MITLVAFVILKGEIKNTSTIRELDLGELGVDQWGVDFE